MVEGARLESVYTPKVYRGFESRPLRNNVEEEGMSPSADGRAVTQRVRFQDLMLHKGEAFPSKLDYPRPHSVSHIGFINSFAERQ